MKKHYFTLLDMFTLSYLAMSCPVHSLIPPYMNLALPWLLGMNSSQNCIATYLSISMPQLFTHFAPSAISLRRHFIQDGKQYLENPIVHGSSPIFLIHLTASISNTTPSAVQAYMSAYMTFWFKLRTDSYHIWPTDFLGAYEGIRWHN